MCRISVCYNNNNLGACFFPCVRTIWLVLENIIRHFQAQIDCGRTVGIQSIYGIRQRRIYCAICVARYKCILVIRIIQLTIVFSHRIAILQGKNFSICIIIFRTAKSNNCNTVVYIILLCILQNRR